MNEERKEVMLKINQQTFTTGKSLTHVLLGTRLYVGLLNSSRYSVFPKCLAEFAALSEADGVAAVKSFRGEQTTMEPIIDFLAEEELKAAEKIVMGIFEVKQARHCRPVISRKDARKARKAGKHVRVAELVKDLRAKAAGAGR